MGYTVVVQLLLEVGADPNQPNAAGETALHYAAQHAEPTILQLLVFQGEGNVNVVDHKNRTPLDWACEKKSLQTVLWLLNESPINIEERKKREVLKQFEWKDRLSISRVTRNRYDLSPPDAVVLDEEEEDEKEKEKEKEKEMEMEGEKEEESKDVLASGDSLSLSPPPSPTTQNLKKNITTRDQNKAQTSPSSLSRHSASVRLSSLISPPLNRPVNWQHRYYQLRDQYCDLCRKVKLWVKWIQFTFLIILSTKHTHAPLFLSYLSSLTVYISFSKPSKMHKYRVYNMHWRAR
jgi:ankyrin repeat protein